MSLKEYTPRQSYIQAIEDVAHSHLGKGDFRKLSKDDILLIGAAHVAQNSDAFLEYLIDQDFLCDTMPILLKLIDSGDDKGDLMTDLSTVLEKYLIHFTNDFNEIEQMYEEALVEADAYYKRNPQEAREWK